MSPIYDVVNPLFVIFVNNTKERSLPKIEHDLLDLSTHMTKPGFVRFSFCGFLCISLGFLYLSWNVIVCFVSTIGKVKVNIDLYGASS